MKVKRTITTNTRNRTAKYRRMACHSFELKQYDLNPNKFFRHASYLLAQTGVGQLTCLRDFLIIGCGLSSSSENGLVRGSKSRLDEANDIAREESLFVTIMNRLLGEKKKLDFQKI